MTKAAGNPGGDGGIGAGLGAGMGMAMAERMARTGPWGAAPGRRDTAAGAGQRQRRWHVAEGGAAKGPYTRDELGRLASEGKVGPRHLPLDPGRARTGSAAAT